MQPKLTRTRSNMTPVDFTGMGRRGYGASNGFTASSLRCQTAAISSNGDVTIGNTTRLSCSRAPTSIRIRPEWCACEISRRIRSFGWISAMSSRWSFRKFCKTGAGRKHLATPRAKIRQALASLGKELGWAIFHLLRSRAGEDFPIKSRWA